MEIGANLGRPGLERYLHLIINAGPRPRNPGAELTYMEQLRKDVMSSFPPKENGRFDHIISNISQ